MNLVDENVLGGTKSNKKIFIACGVAIVILLFVVIALLAYAITANKGMKLVIDNKKAKSSVLWKDGDDYYIQIESLVNSLNNGYSYKIGDPDVPDANGCYITNSVENTVFTVDSKSFYKITKNDDGTQTTAYYDMDKPIKYRDEDNSIYMPVSAVKIATNSNCEVTDKQIKIESIGHIQSLYDKEVKSKNSSFVRDESIKWDVSYNNKKLLRDRLVIVRDNNNPDLYGVGQVKIVTEGKGKKKKQTVTHSEVISPRYKSIEYIERLNQLVVETNDGKGIIQLYNENGNIKGKTLVTPQYDDIRPVNNELYVIGEKVIVGESKSTTADKKEEFVIRYGLINKEQEKLVPSEYEYIGVDKAYLYTNNDLKDEFIVLEKYIPVKKDSLWGLIDLEGNTILKPTYDELGCTETNPSSNMLIIPELDAFIYKRGRTYGISYFTGEIILKNVLSRIYIDTTKAEKTYYMICQNVTYPVLDYIKEMNYMENIIPKNEEEEENQENKTNTTNTTNKTNTTNATNTTNTTPEPTVTTTQSNNTVVIINPTN